MLTEPGGYSLGTPVALRGVRCLARGPRFSRNAVSVFCHRKVPGNNEVEGVGAR